MPSAIYFLPILFGVAHGLLFAILLAVRAVRGGRSADGILALLILAGALRMAPYLLGFLDFDVLWNEWLFLPLDTGLLIGPLILLYLRAQTDGEFRLAGRDLVHFIPYAVFGAYRLAVFSRDADFVFEWIDRIDLPVIQPMVTLLTGASLAIYLFLSIQHVTRYRRWLDSEHVDTESINLGWLRSFLIALSLAIVAAWFFGALSWSGYRFNALQAWWPFAISTATLYYLSIAGYLHPQSGKVHYVPEAEEEPSPVTGPSETTLAPEEVTEWSAKLQTLMKEEQIFLQTQLTLSDVARRLGAPRDVISQVINTRFGVNYRRFINGYRVQAVREALDRDSNRQLTLVGIAYDCGFNSKATFNRVFKQIADLTPREYTELRPEERASLPEFVPVPLLVE